MHRYNTTDLYNHYVQEQATEAFDTGCLDDTTCKAIKAAYPHTLYTPNLFIRIALGLLTVVAVLFSGALTGLLFSASGSGGFIVLCIVLSIACYTALEMLVKTRHYYNAGVDNILMTATLIFFISAFLIDDFPDKYIWISGLATVLCVWLSLRFTDAFMAVLGYLSFYIMLFLLYLKFGDFAKTSAPLVMAIIAASIYTVAKKWQDNKRFFYYRFPVTAIIAATLLTFYASVNYFVVKELSNELFHVQLSRTSSIPLGLLLWIATILVPLLYILHGIRKKELLFIRTGLVLAGAAVLTVRYYHSLLPLPWALLMAGLILIAVSYALIQYLKTSRFGFTFQSIRRTNEDRRNAEAVATGQIFSKKATLENGFQFGGGSGGGAGATGNY